VEQPQRSTELSPFARSLLGATVTGIWRLAAVSDDGVLPLPGELVLATTTGFVSLSYTQGGLLPQVSQQRAEIRWVTEPDLAMGNEGTAEEWLELVPLDDLEHVPELPLLVEVVTGWFGVGPYLDTFALILGGRDQSLVLMTTDDYDLRIVTRLEARERAVVVAANMGQRLVEQEQRLDAAGRRSGPTP
jgi:hypothetical protein